MSDSLQAFLSNSESLIAHLNYEKELQLFYRKGLGATLSNSALEIDFESLVVKIGTKFLMKSKVYSYQNAIISLYGFLERFVEDRVDEYLRSLAEVCPEYHLLPHPIRKHHLGLSLDLISKMQKNKAWSTEERKIGLSRAINNMKACLDEEKGFSINFDAFTKHTSNVRYDTIHSMFTNVGINGVTKLSLRDKRLVFALSEKQSIEGDMPLKVMVSLIMKELNDLAQRRNEIAHGVIIDDIESIDITTSRIHLMMAYARALGQVVTEHFDQYNFAVSPKICLGPPSNTFPNLRVIGFMHSELKETGDTRIIISKGNKLFAVNENSPDKYIYGTILSLRMGNTERTQIELPTANSFSIGVDFEISSHFSHRSVYVLPDK